MHISEEQFSEFGVTFGIAAFILYMPFIIGGQAKQSQAGKLGTFGCAAHDRTRTRESIEMAGSVWPLCRVLHNGQEEAFIRNKWCPANGWQLI